MIYRKPILLLILALLMVSCDKLFEFSPYSAYVPNSRKNTTEQNLEKLLANSDSPDFKPFEFTLISDNHLFYDELQNAIEHINKHQSADFLIHGGDMTDGGLIKEYDIFQDLMEDLETPYFTVIGNHDLLANGRSIYADMFGPENYSFVYNNCKFIFFNNVVWELNFTEPDFRWLRNELFDREQFTHVFVIAHIPPWTDQFFLSYFYIYNLLMTDYNVSLSIHGHHHNPAEYQNDTLPEEITIGPNLVIGAPQKNVYRKVKVLADTVLFETINFVE
ncbi:MAG: metallophosphoesterase [Bacteroidales bacterium]|jgi:3',5'-cyclic AMP phosphodiesterase CpdA|nr:metallophosphoesterase [Bacteroidales bacterium]HOI32641.1 metallophosphoesterase [Bacteroidales bacterium]